MPLGHAVIGTVKGDMHDIVKIMVGVASVTQEFADEIGADAYTPDAGAAAESIALFYN